MHQPHQKVLILTAPSGSGKTSITRYLLSVLPSLAFSVSAATRQPRVGEIDGEAYYFLSIAEFQQKIREEAFIEWEMVYEGSYYGTLKAELERIWAKGQFPILDIDVKGAIHVQQQLGDNCCSIFIQPPSVEELKLRLEARGTETPESLASRLGKAEYEISFSHQFKHRVINRDLDKACAETAAIVREFLGQ